ncbi:EcsC family protein [Heyndrickxia sp. NPDC080065]|uniref:EcsC family protein n=1 Tax=Heyndrickxia sp. NPDC080065 TaxID=3390568 RepID=UPI003D04DAE9
MNWTERDREVWQQVQEWIHTLHQEELNDFKRTYEKWVNKGLSLIPEKFTEAFFGKLDTWLFHLNALIQSLEIQDDTRKRILRSARIFDENIHTISDMKNLTIDQASYISDQYSARHRLYSFVQGGITGTGKKIILSTDFLVMILLNLRAVQITAMSYGYEIKTPYEMMTSLKVFHAATLPKHLKGNAWEQLMIDLEQSQYFYEGTEQVTTFEWLEEPFKQLVKACFISSFHKEKDSKLSLIPIVIGAGVNYKFSKKVTDFADTYYKYRYLQDKGC